MERHSGSAWRRIRTTVTSEKRYKTTLRSEIKAKITTTSEKEKKELRRVQWVWGYKDFTMIGKSATGRMSPEVVCQCISYFTGFGHRRPRSADRGEVQGAQQLGVNRQTKTRIRGKEGMWMYSQENIVIISWHGDKYPFRRRDTLCDVSHLR